MHKRACQQQEHGCCCCCSLWAAFLTDWQNEQVDQRYTVEGLRVTCVVIFSQLRQPTCLRTVLLQLQTSNHRSLQRSHSWCIHQETSREYNIGLAEGLLPGSVLWPCIKNAVTFIQQNLSTLILSAVAKEESVYKSYMLATTKSQCWLCGNLCNPWSKWTAISVPKSDSLQNCHSNKSCLQLAVIVIAIHSMSINNSPKLKYLFCSYWIWD